MENTYPTKWKVTKNVDRYQVWRQVRALEHGEPMHSGVREYYPGADFDTREQAEAFVQKLNRPAIKESGNVIEGHEGTWYIIDQLTLPDDFVLYLMESEQYGDEIPAIIVGQDGRVF